MIQPLTNAAALLSFVAQASAARMMWERPVGNSKRHPVGDSETGPEAGAK